MDGYQGIGEQFLLMARQCGEIEAFASRALGLMGSLFGARLISLYLREAEQANTILGLTLSRDSGGWQTLHGLPDSCLPRTRPLFPRYLFRSYFCFFLALPPRWSGSFLVAYPGIKCLSRNQRHILESLLSKLKEALIIVLTEREIAILKEALVEKDRINRELKQSVTTLTKEAYCVSGVITGLTQSVNAVNFFTRILGTTLPLLKAVTGHVYFPETDRCLMVHSEAGLFRIAGQYSQGDRVPPPCVKGYLKPRSSGAVPGGISLRSMGLSDPGISCEVASHFRSMGVRSLMEFALGSGEKPFGLGLVGFAEDRVRESRRRLFMMTLNMTALFLENISLMKDLERQVQSKSSELRKMEKKQQFVFDQVSQPFLRSTPGPGHSSEQILERIDSSRRAVFLGELASGVAHQIRNPLNNLIAVLHLIKSQDTMEQPENSRLLQEVTGRVETIHQMINKFIHYTRIPELNLTSESINAVLKNTLQTFRSRAELRGVRVTEAFDPRLTMTKMDLYLMDQAYQNIIGNAVDAMGGEGRLTVSTRKLGVKHGPNPRLKFAEISFRDTGPGIPGGDIKNILTPFFSRKKDGIGLGLAIVDHIVGFHGGGVRVENRQEGGLNVSVYLPIR